ncbi:MAG: glycosyltransferase family 4 protein [Verrucomicrobia bacterium]|nr:glycosyltransferase family 4 protein [Verrucomicrobiota bacterium]
MKVLHLAGNYEDAGGILSVIRHLQEATRPQGWSHSVLVHRRYVETRQPALDYRFSRFVCSELTNHYEIAWRAALAVLEVRRLLAREPFDIVHAHSRCGFLVAFGISSWLRRRVLFTNHDYARRVRMYHRAANYRNFYTVLLTPNMARHYGLREQPPKVNVISACCGDRFFNEPLAPESPPPANTRTLRLVGAGSILRWKKWDLLAQALTELNDSERKRIDISIWGPVVQTDPDSPRYETELRQCLKRQGLEERMALRGSASAMTEKLRQADWFVLPSTNEPCSVALMEALALGLPALVSASGGNIDIVRDRETGCFFEPGNPTDLANKLRAILDCQIPVWPAKKIRESVLHRSATAVSRKYDALYRELVAACD